MMRIHLTVLLHAFRRRAMPLSAGLLLASLAGGPALADDTEVFKSALSVSQASSLRPNVLFVLDTSGSMGSEVDDVQPFKTAKEQTFYDGGQGTCRHDRIYWSVAPHNVPSCDTRQYFKKNKLRCKAALDLLKQGGPGRFQDRLARFKTERLDWRPLKAGNHRPPHIECRADRGQHGQDNQSTKTYAVSGAADPWRTSPSGEIDWESTGKFYTLYSGKYMNYVHNVHQADPGNPSRLEVVKAAANQIAAINRHSIRAGLMRFDTTLYFKTHSRRCCVGNAGGPVLLPIQPIGSQSANSTFQTLVDGLTDGGATPLSETLYEAFLYYTGRSPLFGTLQFNHFKSAPSSMSDGKYLSPIKTACQKNFIVLLTDGEPFWDLFADTRINEFLSAFNSDPNRLTGKHMTDTSCRTTGQSSGDNCLDELAEYMAGIDHSNTLDGDQPINTFTIGFHTNQQLLKDTARKGGGEFHEANNALELNAAFQSILASIQEQTNTFSAPTVSVNAFNRITNLDNLFFSVFTPANTLHWPGNLKQYQLACATEHPTLEDFCADGSDSGTEPDPPVIVDANGNPAVDDSTGFFKESARSIWTDVAAGADGHQTELGGIAHTFGGYTGVSGSNDNPPNPERKVYTYTGPYNNNGGTLTPPQNRQLLSHNDNKLREINALLTAEVDDLPSGGGDGKLESFFYPDGRDSSEPTLLEIIQFARGIDVQDNDADGLTTDARHEIGDALHSRPRVVTYGRTHSGELDLALFTINNDGFLHAVKVQDGSELFSWMPQELLSRLPEQFSNSKTTEKSYGLDGPLTVWTKDVDKDGEIEPSDGDRVYLYLGQRRGGKHYWALDVTNRTAPKLLWKITGGVSGSDFNELGQSWSAPIKSRVMLNNTIHDVLFFTAGYDEAQDTAGPPQDDTMGRALFMVDAVTGRRLWHAGHPAVSPTPNLPLGKMTNSIPSDIRIFDIDGDGLDDRIYVADTRGQLWRFDIHNRSNTGAGAASPNEFITGAVIAELQKASSTATPGIEDNRRFYYRPDVALATPEEAQPFLAITLGSGHRAHPLDKQVHDRFYMIRDPKIGNTRSYPQAFTEDDLFNITETLSPNRGQLFGTAGDPKVGWMLDLIDPLTDTFIGEKSLAEPLIFNNIVLFTTFVPPEQGLTANCQPTQGSGRVFAIDLFDGSPVRDLDGDGDDTSANYTRADRNLKLLRGGIPPNVVVLFSRLNGVTPVAFVAAEQLDLSFTDAAIKTYWFQQEVH